MRLLFPDVVCCTMSCRLISWSPCMKESLKKKIFLKGCLFLNGELISKNDLISPCLRSNGNLGQDQTFPPSWLQPSLLNIVFKWNIWHIFQQGRYFVPHAEMFQNSLKNRLNGRIFSPIDIWSFLSKLMRSFIWTRKALIQTLRSPISQLIGVSEVGLTASDTSLWNALLY